MRRILAFALLSALTTTLLSADVSIIERQTAHTKAAKSGKGKRPGITNATGSISLIDAQGLKYFINTNITFSTSSSASGAASEASYTHAVAASTSGGGTTSSTLNDAFDGYESMCLVVNNSVTAPCATGNANFVIYNKNGPATTECPGPVSHVNRQVVFPVQTSGNVQMFRKVFVPDNDQFARWLNYFTNTGASPVTVTMETSNNLGSDSNTVIVATSAGGATINTTDTWVTTFQNFSGKTTSDPRLGHVLQGGPGVATPLSGIFFQNGNDNPYWGYTFTLNPGQTKIIMNFVTGQPSRPAANAKAAQLVGLPPNTLQCLTTAEMGEIVNFQAQTPVGEMPTLSETSMIIMGMLLALAALVLLRRRATATA
jgi:hypothetical protein